MTATPVITKYAELYDVQPLGDDEILVPEGGVMVAKHLSALASFETFAGLSDVVGSGAGDGLWARESGALVRLNPTELAHKTKAGVISDADFSTPADGDIAVNTRDNQLVYRSSGAWHGLAPAQIPDYAIVSDGSVCYAVDKTGAIAYRNTSRDSGAILQSALNALATTAGNAVGTIVFGPQQHDHKTQANLPRVATGTTPDPGWLTIRGAGRYGAGTTITLTTAAPQWLGVGRVADDDWFGQFTIEDFLFDRNNIQPSSGSHVIFSGCNSAAFANLYRTNLQHIEIRRCRAINIPHSTDLAKLTRTIEIVSRHNSAAQAQTLVTDILIEDVQILGGNYGAFIAGMDTGSGTVLVNVYLDRIRVERLYHDTGIVPTAFAGDVAVHIGALGSGGSCTVRGCYSKGSGDVAYEIDTMQDLLVEDCEGRDYWNNAFLIRNFGTPPNPAAQTATLRNCRSKILSATIDGSANANLCGYRLNDPSFTSQYGHIILEGCTHHTKQTVAGVGVDGWAIRCEGPLTKLTLRDFAFVGDNFNDATTSVVFPAGLLIAPTSDLELVIRNAKVVYSGSFGTGIRLRPFKIGAAASGDTIDVDIDGVSFDLFLRGFSTTVGPRLIELGEQSFPATMRGTIRNVKVVRWNADASGTGIYVSGTRDLTIDGMLQIEDSDFRKFTSGADVVCGTETATNAAKVNIVGHRGSTFPSTGADISLTGSPFTWQNLQSRQVFVIVAGGEVNKIEWSSDGSTWRDTGFVGGPITLDSGTYLRVTYNSDNAPTLHWEPTR